MVRVTFKKEMPVQIPNGSVFCPKKKGGRRYQIEVALDMCKRCNVRKQYKCKALQEASGGKR